MNYKPSYVGEQELVQEFQQISNALDQAGTLPLVYAEPPRPRVGQVFLCDGVSWNPLGRGKQEPVYFVNGAWQAFSGGGSSGGTFDAGGPSTDYTGAPLFDCGGVV